MELFDIWIYLDSNLNCHFQRILLDWLQPLYFYNSISWVVDKPNIQLDSPKRLWHEGYLICMLAIRTKKINEQAADWSLSPGWNYLHMICQASCFIFKENRTTYHFGMYSNDTTFWHIRWKFVFLRVMWFSVLFVSLISSHAGLPIGQIVFITTFICIANTL